MREVQKENNPIYTSKQTKQSKAKQIEECNAPINQQDLNN